MLLALSVPDAVSALWDFFKSTLKDFSVYKPLTTHLPFLRLCFEAATQNK